MNNGLKIIPAYKGMAEYVKLAEMNPDCDLERLWSEKVLEPYWTEWAAGQFNEEMVRMEMENPITDIEGLGKAVDVLTNSHVEGIIASAYERITGLLPYYEPCRVICVYIDTRIDESLHGIVGSCVGDNVLIRINPFIKEWEDYAGWVLAHEHHHSIWGYNYFFVKGNRGSNLLTSLLVDGQADSFAKSIYPELNANWTEALTAEQEMEQWQTIKECLKEDDTRELHIKFFFGGNGTPPNTAYTIGYHIVQLYLKRHPEVSFNELLDKDSWEILKESSYDGVFYK
jgi:uncharacterized protein YjaZ